MPRASAGGGQPGAAMAVGLAVDDSVRGMVLDILDAVPFYVLLVDEHHTILLANGAVRDTLGLQPSEVIGGYCPRLVHGQDTPYAGCPLEEAVITGQPAVCEMLDPKSDRWLESAIYPTRHHTAAGARVYLHIVRDITDRKRAEQERGELAARLEEALAKVISGFIPVCAACRRIRSTDGSWHMAEAYLAHRTGAELSHGLCPVCAERLYGKRDQEQPK